MNNQPTKALVTKSNNLVEARYHFSIWETRVFTKLVSLIQPGDEDFKKYKLYIKDLVSFFGVKDNDAYVKIKAVPDNLLKKVVTIPYTTENGEERFLKTGLIAQASIPKKKEGYIELSFHPDLKPYLLQLKRTFLSYDISNVLKISSVYSVRIYELLKQYEKIGHREFDIETLKATLGVSDKYKLYGHFKSRIILKAQKDLKQHTDIYFNFKEVKSGRRVVAIIFEIKKNKNTEIPEKTRVNIDVPPLREEIEITLLNWGISPKTLNIYWNSYSLEHLKGRIRYVKNQQELKSKRDETIANLAAYFNTVVSKSDLVDYVEEERVSQKNKKVAAKNKVQQKKQLKGQLTQLKRKLEGKEQEYIGVLFDSDSTFKEVIFQQARDNSSSFYSDKTKSNQAYFDTNPLFRAAVFTLVKKQYFKEFEDIREGYKFEIEKLVKQIRLV